MNERNGTLEWLAENCGNRIGVVENDRQLTWKQLNEQANSLAEGLHEAGLGAGDVVCVRLQVRIEWVILNAALGKLGCSLLGINWRLTPEETRFVIEDSGAVGLVLDDEDPMPVLTALEGHPMHACVAIGDRVDGCLAFSDLVNDRSVRTRYMDSEAPLIIYTSGTTGKPKGVVVQPLTADPDELLDYVSDIGSRIPLTDKSVVLVSMPFSHGSGPVQVRSAIAAGAQIVLQRRFDAEGTLALIQRHRVTNWVCVPTMLKRMASLPASILSKYDMSSLEALQVGAAPVTPALKDWANKFFGRVLHEGYGSTETGMITHILPEEESLKPGSSGRPYRQVSISIRDESGLPVPTGMRGEIWAKTPFVIRNYLGGPPLGPDVLDEDGYFRTGDIGLIDTDGYLFLTDRAKDMIVSGGVNIYPAEIEAVLLGHADVQDAAVFGIPDEEFGEQVRAVIELKPGHTATVDDLAKHAARGLASYKCPRSFEIIEQLPRNAMGKILKRVLREPYWANKERAI